MIRQRSFSATSWEIRRILRDAGFSGRGCMAISTARAIAIPDDDADVAAWLPVVIPELRAHFVQTYSLYSFGRQGLDHKGTHWGDIGFSLDELGIYNVHVKPEPRYLDRAHFGERFWIDNDYGGSTYEQAYYPTVTRWLRENPNVRRAVIHTNHHVAFIDRSAVYAAGARHRVIDAYILEGETT